MLEGNKKKIKNMRAPMQTLNALGDMEDSILEMCMVFQIKDGED